MEAKHREGLECNELIHTRVGEDKLCVRRRAKHLHPMTDRHRYCEHHD